MHAVLLFASALHAAQAGDALPKPKTTALLQAWVTAWDQDEDPITDPAAYGDPEDDPGLKLRRARLGIRSDGEGPLSYELTFGTSAPYDAVLGNGNPDVGIIDAYAGYEIVKGLTVSGGMLKVPASRDWLISTADHPFGERSVGAQWVAPGRDTGLMLDGRFGKKDALRGRIRAGVFNGNGFTTGNFAYFGDNNPGKLVAVRAEGAFGPGNVYKTFGKVDGFTLSVAGDFWSNNDLGTRTLGYGGDMLMRVAGLSLMLEGHVATLSPSNSDIVVPGVLADTPRLGTVALLGYTVGRFEPVIGFSTFDDHRSLDDNGDVAIGQGGVIWHGKDDMLRAGAAYITRQELNGTALQNDSARLWLQFSI